MTEIKELYDDKDSIPVTFPKSAVLREITAKDGEDFTVIKLSGKYRGYEFIYPSRYIHESRYEEGYLFTYMRPNRTVTINKRRRNEESGEYENVESRELSPQELKDLFASKRSWKR